MMIDEIQKQRTVLRVITARRVITAGGRTIQTGNEDLDVIIRGWTGETGQFGSAQRDADHVRRQALISSADLKTASDEFMPYASDLVAITLI